MSKSSSAFSFFKKSKFFSAWLSGFKHILGLSISFIWYLSFPFFGPQKTLLFCLSSYWEGVSPMSYLYPSLLSNQCVVLPLLGPSCRTIRNSLDTFPSLKTYPAPSPRKKKKLKPELNHSVWSKAITENLSWFVLSHPKPLLGPSNTEGGQCFRLLFQAPHGYLLCFLQVLVLFSSPLLPGNHLLLFAVCIFFLSTIYFSTTNQLPPPSSRSLNMFSMFRYTSSIASAFEWTFTLASMINYTKM